MKHIFKLQRKKLQREKKNAPHVCFIRKKMLMKKCFQKDGTDQITEINELRRISFDLSPEDQMRPNMKNITASEEKYQKDATDLEGVEN